MNCQADKIVSTVKVQCITVFMYCLQFEFSILFDKDAEDLEFSNGSENLHFRITLKVDNLWPVMTQPAIDRRKGRK